jgi:uncharacterized protein (DUF58 family)
VTQQRRDDRLWLLWPVWFVLWALWMLFAYGLLFASSLTYTGLGRVKYHQNHDTQGIQTYTIDLGATGGKVTILADDDLPVAKLLKDSKAVQFTLERVELQHLER